MKIYLVRHGQAAAKWHEADDPGLSTLGRQQATAVALQLAKGLDPKADLISSPLLRARETAQPLAETLGATVSINEAFREIPTPVPLAERQTWLKSIARQEWKEQHPAVIHWYDSLLQQLAQIGRPAVVFTHFMALNAIVSALSAEARVVSFLPDNASITTVQLKDGSLQLVELGRQLRTVIH